MSNFLQSVKNYLFPKFYEECVEIEDSYILSKNDEYHEVIIYDDNGNNIGRCKEHISVSYIIERKHVIEGYTLYSEDTVYKDGRYLFGMIPTPAFRESILTYSND